MTERGLEYKSGFVFNPDRYYSPSYRISPFSTRDVAANLALPDSKRAQEYFDSRFTGKRWDYTSTGKEAIALSLQALQLKKDDVVTILTTSGNLYVSGCVTREIEKVCSWSRKMESATRAIFVIHEFGYPYRDLSALKNYELPIIEDGCHSFLCDIPSVGDFLVYSLPKLFPVQMGGLLAFNPEQSVSSSVISGSELSNHLSRVIGESVPRLDEFRNIRIKNHRALENRFSALGCTARFDLIPGDVPGVFLFKTPRGVDLPAMKEYGWKHGIECSVFYGEDGFFIPVHQRLKLADLDYFYAVFREFISG